MPSNHTKNVKKAPNGFPFTVEFLFLFFNIIHAKGEDCKRVVNKIRGFLESLLLTVLIRLVRGVAGCGPTRG